MHKSRSSFKNVLNNAVRAGLGEKPREAKTKPFRINARPLGLKPGYDPAGFNKLVDEVEGESFVELARKTAHL